VEKAGKYEVKVVVEDLAGNIKSIEKSFKVN
jgi:hypothetical protein